MIHSFAVSNYGPFKDRIVFDFTAGKSVIDDNRFFIAPSGAVLSKAIVLFGPNGSGKTKALQAWSFFRWFALYSYSTVDKDSNIPQLDPFRFQDAYEESDTEFECKFEAQGDLYKYILKLNRSGIVYEALKKQPVEKATKWPYLYRLNNKRSFSLDIRDPLSKYEKLVGYRDNCTVFSRLRATDDEYIDAISEAFDGYDNLGFGGRQYLTDLTHLSETAESYKESPELFKYVREVMGMLGMQMDRIEIKRFTTIREGAEEELDLPLSVYIVDGEEYQLPFWLESDGTKATLTLLGPMLAALDQGSILVLDELDQDMHPNLVKSMFSIMLDSSYNISNCQVVCSTHCPEVLDKLHRRQVYLVERDNKRYMSTLLQLSDVIGLTNKDNIKSKYLSGAFGAIPEQF